MRPPQAELEAEHNEIIARIADLQTEGDVLTGVRLDKAAAGGTASNKSQTRYKYARLRSGAAKCYRMGRNLNTFLSSKSR